MRVDLEQRFNVNKITNLENDLRSKKKVLKNLQKETSIQQKLREKNDDRFKKMNGESTDQRDQLSNLN